MPNYSHAWATVMGKVFVEKYEIEQKLQEKFPQYKKQVRDDEEGNTCACDLATYDEVRDTFEEIAREKLWDLFPTDEPMKVNEIVIDLSTYRQ